MSKWTLGDKILCSFMQKVFMEHLPCHVTRLDSGNTWREETSRGATAGELILRGRRPFHREEDRDVTLLRCHAEGWKSQCVGSDPHSVWKTPSKDCCVPTSGKAGAPTCTLSSRAIRRAPAAETPERPGRKLVPTRLGYPAVVIVVTNRPI